MNCTKTDCPAAPQCTKTQYRGSTCAALRDKYGLGDPLTNADKYFRQATDEELAAWLDEMQTDAFDNGESYSAEWHYPTSVGSWIDWLKEEANDDG